MQSSKEKMLLWHGRKREQVNKMVENKYPYDNWKSITESDFVTLFIKTWFAFVSTLREMYPAEIPYYETTISCANWKKHKRSKRLIIHRLARSM